TGIILAVLGYIGTLIGGLIKAAVSRQREFLADASAVQFTRNAGGIAGALKRIGAQATGSRLQSPRAPEVSHMYFAQGVWEGFTRLTATHPPLAERIRRLEPSWNGRFPESLRLEPSPLAMSRSEAPKSIWGTPQVQELAPTTRMRGGELQSGTAPLDVVRHAADQVGEPHELHRLYAAELIASMPSELVDAAREPYGARAVMFALLLDKSRDVRAIQLQRVEQFASGDLTKEMLRLAPFADALDARARLPLVDLALPALRALSEPQYRAFVRCFRELVAADKRVGLFEWTLHRIILRHLAPQFERKPPVRVAYYGLKQLAAECSVLLSTLALADNRIEDAPAALARGASELPDVRVSMLSRSECGLNALHKALDRLAQLAPKLRGRVVAACAACICADREVTIAEAELLRGVCDMLDCPLPPLIAGQPIEERA
ncbi:MAG: M48 family metalloprotease, partial [Planctomycetales bacterium]|nr:M48 family metalloprotease [Planctomycetales bacterium]